MKAIILVAGIGNRLSSRVTDRPKCLVEVGDRTILDWQLQHLRACGVRDVVLVTGYLREMVQDHVQAYGDMDFSFIVNDRFSETNTAYSLYLARHEMTDEFLYLNGDVFFHPEVVRRLLTACEPNVLAMERKQCGEEEVKAVLDGTRITAISKTVDPKSAYGEFIGVARFSRGIGPFFRATLERVIEKENKWTDFFEKALDAMAAKVEFTALDITDLPCVEIDFPQDLDHARKSVLPRITRDAAAPLRILFYAERSLHLPFLEPVHDYLAKHTEAELAFSASPFTPSHNGSNGCGLAPEVVERLRRKSTFYERASDFQADVAVVADPCHHLISHVPRVVNVGHGLICKGYYYNDNPITKRENLSDLLCVPGPEHKKRLEKTVFSPIAVTGFIKSDEIYGRKQPGRADFCRTYGIDPTDAIILFAPTFNDELSAIPCLGERIGELAGPGTTLLIKLHNETAAGWKSAYQRLAESRDTIHYLEDGDYAGMMRAADVMVSDVSSIALEFLFLNKPVVFFTNPRIKEYHQYHAGDIEYAIRDAGFEAKTMEELSRAVNISLSEPHRFEDKRRAYADMYDYGRDGKSAARVAQAVQQLAESPVEDSSCSEEITIILRYASAPDRASVTRDVREIRRKSGGVGYRVVAVGGQPPVKNVGSLGIDSWLESETLDAKSLVEAGRAAGGEFVVYLKPGQILPQNWLKSLRNYFRWHQGTGLVKALVDSHFIKKSLGTLFYEKELYEKSKLSEFLQYMAVGSNVPGVKTDSHTVMMPRHILTRPEIMNCGLDAETWIESLPGLLLDLGYQAWMAADVFLYPHDQPLAYRNKQELLEELQQLRLLARQQRGTPVGTRTGR